MANENRFQQLVDLGVVDNIGKISPLAKDTIRDLSDPEFQFLLSLRGKIFEKGGAEARAEYDQCLSLII